MQQIKDSIKEALQSVLPIATIVLLLSISIAPMDAGLLVLFLFGTGMLILGMSFFTIGSGISMETLGEGIGKKIGKAKKIWLPLILCVVLGILITVAEPDLQVLAEQVPSIPNLTLILCVAVGVGLFLAISMVRIRRGTPLPRLLLVCYGAIIVLAFFAPAEFVPTAFDSGGVTTGPITVPFIMALGTGMAHMGKDRHSGENSFGLVALCSVGPILSVLILSICYNPTPETSESVLPVVETTRDAFTYLLHALPEYGKEVLIALLPIVAVFVLFQLISHRYHRYQIVRISIGFIYTYVGLALFLAAANVGFMPAGRLIGSAIADNTSSYLLMPIGILMGYFVVSAEPAVHSLKKQVSEVTNGAVSQRAIGYALSIGVGLAVGIAMLRVLTGIPILPFLIAGYVIALAISFLVPPIYTGIAFDSGGVASGPMTTTFILPFAVGACTSLGGNVMTDAFGIVAMIAMAPLISIQILGLNATVQHRRRIKRSHAVFTQFEDDIIYFEQEDCA